MIKTLVVYTPLTLATLFCNAVRIFTKKWHIFSVTTPFPLVETAPFILSFSALTKSTFLLLQPQDYFHNLITNK